MSALLAQVCALLGAERVMMTDGELTVLECAIRNVKENSLRCVLYSVL